MRKCKATANNGKRCEAWAQQASSYCFFHDGSKELERKIAQRRGGSRKHRKVLPLNSMEKPPKSAQDVVELLGKTINQVKTGDLDTKVGNTIGYLCAALLRASEQSDLELRIYKLESSLLGNCL